MTREPSCSLATEKKCGLFLSEVVAGSSASAKTQLLLGVRPGSRWREHRTKKHNHFRYVDSGDLIYL